MEKPFEEQPDELTESIEQKESRQPTQPVRDVKVSPVDSIEEPIELFPMWKRLKEEVVQDNFFDSPTLNNPNILGEMIIGEGKIFPVDAKVYFNSGDTHIFSYDTSGITLASGLKITGGGNTFTETYTSPKSTTASATWEEWDISAIVPVGTTAVEVQILNTSVSSEDGGAREYGSSLERKQWGKNYTSMDLRVNVGSNRIIEIYAQVRNNQYFFITGYYT